MRALTVLADVASSPANGVAEPLLSKVVPVYDRRDTVPDAAPGPGEDVWPGPLDPVDVPCRPLDPAQLLPAAARPGDAGTDLRAAHGAHLEPGGGRAVVGTGLSLAIPWGYCGLVVPRSGLARDHGVTCLNTPGLIDAGYRGEVQVLLVNTDPRDAFTVEPGDRIAQLVVLPFTPVRFMAVDELDTTERGEQGWGHSGRR